MLLAETLEIYTILQRSLHLFLVDCWNDGVSWTLEKHRTSHGKIEEWTSGKIFIGWKKKLMSQVSRPISWQVFPWTKGPTQNIFVKNFVSFFYLFPLYFQFQPLKKKCFCLQKQTHQNQRFFRAAFLKAALIISQRFLWN